jgi:predicted DNA-binding transcriptional regulator AlpA
MPTLQVDDTTARQSRALDRARKVPEVAEIFGTSARHIWRLIKAGELKAERLSPRCVRVFDSEIVRYRDSLRSNAA